MAKVPAAGQTTVEVVLRIPVDGEMLAVHAEKAEERGGPYSRDPEEWDGSDVMRLPDLDIVDASEVELVRAEIVAEDPA